MSPIRMSAEEEQARLARRLFCYEPDTGLLRWKEDRMVGKRKSIQVARAGTIAGARHNGGYWQVRLEGRNILAHRVIWLIVHGRWPSGQIDHVNCCRSDNRLVNLREASGAENSRNPRRRTDNKSGFKGVSWASRENKWHVRITTPDGIYKSLGYYATAAEGAAAYAHAAHELHGAFARVG